ncbi:hypothetical protein [Flavobacterium sp.]|nr:hypothetical protein [Flavobacterium sp.]MBP6182969.1 hypothetical protein [Flavobacterium sp.]
MNNEKECRIANGTYPKGGVSCSKDSFVIKSHPSVSCNTLAVNLKQQK